MAFVGISKLDAAKRQLEMAIKLYFIEDDIVCVHSLMGASYNILRDLYRNQTGEESNLYKGLLTQVKPEKKTKLHNFINRQYNFFKHADKDSEKILKFDMHSTEILMWDCVELYFLVTLEKPEKMNIFKLWFRLQNPDLFFLTEEEKVEINQLKESFQTRRDFFKKAQEINTAKNIL